MALKGVKGPDRVLYALAALLQKYLPAEIISYNNKHHAIGLFTISGNSITFLADTTFSFSTEGTQHDIPIIAGTYAVKDLVDIINAADTPMSASVFSYGALLDCPSSWKVITSFGNFKQNQQFNNIALQNLNSVIINGVLPSEDQIKAFPACTITLDSISPSPDDIMCTYNVSLTVAVTSAINTSQADHLTSQLLKYYDVLHDVITVIDDGGLGGVANGVNILSADVGEATGNSYFLKYLTITLEVNVEED